MLGAMLFLAKYHIKYVHYTQRWISAIITIQLCVRTNKTLLQQPQFYTMVGS